MSSDSNGSSTRLGQRAGRDDVHVTSTGIRIVGREAIELVTQVPDQPGLSLGRDEDVLFAVRLTVRPRLGSASPVTQILSALHRAIAADWVDAPPLTRQRALNQKATRFAGLCWEVSGDVGAWTGELLWRHRHPFVAGAPCTSHVAIAEHATQVTLSVRVTSDSGLAAVRYLVGAGQARPNFLSELNRTTRLMYEGSDIEPRVLTGPAIAGFVREILLSESRRHPVAVLAPMEGGEYQLPQSDVADELLGLAQLYVIDRHASTFSLSDSLGDKRLSCYWGALRVYMPGFSLADRPEEHPLLTKDKVIDPVLRARLIGEVATRVGKSLKISSSVFHRVTTPVAAASQSTSESAVTAQTDPSTAAESLDARNADKAALEPDSAARSLPASGDFSLIAAKLEDLSESIAKLAESNAALSGEIQRLNTATAVRGSNTNALERRISTLVSLLQRQIDASETADDTEEDEYRASTSGADEDSEATTLQDVLRQAASSHSDALLVLDSAERAAVKSPFEDVERVAVILDAMAQVARRRQEGALGVSLRDAFRELGIDYRGGRSDSTSKRHLQQYLITGPGGAQFDCAEHIALGGGYDPRRCLRIYFTSRAPVEPRFVIGHVGRHFDVETTS